MVAHHEGKRARVNAWQEEVTACQEATKAYPEKMEANLKEMTFVSEQEKVPKEEVAVKPVRALKKWCRGWHLYAGFHGKQKDQTHGKSGCWNKLAPTHRRMT
jgi:hypothetical protein